MRNLKSTFALALLLATAPNLWAVGDTENLEVFEGVWIGLEVVADGRLTGSTLAARDIDVAIWTTETGFDMTWKAFGRGGARRITARFVPAAAPDSFQASRVDPPLSGKQLLRARIEGDRLIVHVSGYDGPERVARYERLVADGRMTLRYTLTRGDELLESVTGNLSRAKVLL